MKERRCADHPAQRHNNARACTPVHLFFSANDRSRTWRMLDCRCCCCCCGACCCTAAPAGARSSGPPCCRTRPALAHRRLASGRACANGARRTGQLQDARAVVLRPLYRPSCMKRVWHLGTSGVNHCGCEPLQIAGACDESQCFRGDCTSCCRDTCAQLVLTFGGLQVDAKNSCSPTRSLHALM